MKQTKEAWEIYCKDELQRLEPLLKKYEFTLGAAQPHLGGERFLMQAVTTTSGKKLILLGKTKDGSRVVIKASSDKKGIAEIEREHDARQTLSKIKFAYGVFLSPKELVYTKESGVRLSAQEFIEQEKTFLEHTVEEQFHLALAAFKAQESAHATTYGHLKIARAFFACVPPSYYLSEYKNFSANIRSALPEEHNLHERLERGTALLKDSGAVIEQYSDFLTHTDFVPHNIRIQGGTIYLLDHSSLRFGNKYEGWARLLNYMTLYNQELEQALLTYVKQNRTSEEYDSLIAMRVFRLGEIIWYYTRSLAYVEGNLKKLNTARVHFWSDVLEAVLSNTQVDQERVRKYQNLRDSLRSEDEKIRQKGLH